jgi:hypothetical protein
LTATRLGLRRLSVQHGGSASASKVTR